jgi:hypothetical protein
MAYATSYSTSDFNSIVVDSVGNTGASTVAWLDLIIILIILGFILGLFVKLSSFYR